MWLVGTELEGSTDGTFENFSGMSSIALSHLHFLSQQKVTCCSPNRVSVGASELLHMLFLSSEFPLLACLVGSSSAPGPSPNVTASLKPSLLLLLSCPLIRLGHLSFSTASVLAYFCDWTHHTLMSLKPVPSTMEGVRHSTMNECSTDSCQVSNPQL